MSNTEAEDWADLVEGGVETVDTVSTSLSDVEKQNLIKQGMVLQSLLKSDRFKEFFRINFDLMLDDNTKEMFIVEVPPEVASSRSPVSIPSVFSVPSVSTPSSNIVLGTSTMVKQLDKASKKKKK